MINITKEQFNRYKKENIVFPVVVEINGDEITPISIFYNLEGKNKFLFESCYNGQESGRYSFIGVNPYKTIKSYGDEIQVIEKEGIEKFKGQVLDYIKKFVTVDYNSKEINIPFTGGAVGYAGYDIVRQYENLKCNNIDEINIPEAYFMFYKTIICYDHFRHTLSIIYNVLKESDEDYYSIINEINLLISKIKIKNNIHEIPKITEEKEFKSNFSEEEFCSIVNKAKEYIKKGDVLQVVLSQRLIADFNSNPFDVYRRLRSKNPSPYLFYIDFQDFQVVGSSPESLVSVKGDKVITNPIAGTRPRGRNSEEDNNLKKELLSDEKEISEHIMLVDLGKEDIGNVSEFGSVNVEKYMEVDFYSRVMHIVSKVSGKLKKDYSCFDALKSCLPAGTVSGAPKLRSMEIIDELENVKRGLYAGAVGYFSYNGNMDTCIAIRTVIFKDKKAYLQAGAGIVSNSNAKSEYIETLNKALGVKEVI
ncbi:anthranilate synthase component 1 [Clostridium acetireducens DSM 10703]|jgi:anthranilate synthase component 1|uniref:Anthranilate synthase component 1 n=1 Tax=Clostridium acetireducens DSM 10703 TaxID=1121290 RepID=A0A1E8EYM2_9CLOT|nr:anthranilate synthase component I [Clostridium acetireducens]OFI06084.1 anthranilate synthase component 1 [Clostridium acetireducens DSM 10703]